MAKYRRSSHVVHRLRCHFVFITKYRKPVLRGDIAVEVRDRTREICRTHDIEVVSGHVRPENVHLSLDVPLRLSPSRVMQLIKGKTTHHLLQDWRRHLRARGYFVAGKGNVSDEMVALYIENQDAGFQDSDDFKVAEKYGKGRHFLGDFSRRMNPPPSGGGGPLRGSMTGCFGKAKNERAEMTAPRVADLANDK